MHRYPNVGIVYTDVEFFGAATGKFELPDYKFESMLMANCIVSIACFRKSDWKKTRGYSNKLVYGYEDFDFWLSIIELGRDVYKINETLVFYRQFDDAGQSRSGKRKKDHDKVNIVCVQAFQRHKKLYKKSTRAWEHFSNLEKRYPHTKHRIYRIKAFWK